MNFHGNRINDVIKFTDYIYRTIGIKWEFVMVEFVFEKPALKYNILILIE